MASINSDNNKSEKPGLLIVDDNVGFCATIADVFLIKGYAVDTAYSGYEAEQKVTKTFFDVVLLDMNLPDIDGMELLRRLKEKMPGTEVIMTTGDDTVESSEKALMEGAFAYVTKPFTMGKIIDTVKQALEKQ